MLKLTMMLAATAWLAVPAMAAVPVASGTTSFALDPAFLGQVSALGIDGGPVGTATASFDPANFTLTYSFPITASPAGSLDPASGGYRFSHDGAGIFLRRDATSVFLTNLIFDSGAGASVGLPGQGIVFGNVGIGSPLLTTDFASLAPLYSFSLSEATAAFGPGGATLGNLRLTLTPAAFGALSDSFLRPGEMGPQAFSGIAGASVAAVPEPTTWALLILGFGAVGAGMRRQRRAFAFA